jgi:hypothetical protein
MIDQELQNVKGKQDISTSRYMYLMVYSSQHKKPGFKCDYPGCTYRGSFNRKYELQRHSLKHTAKTRYQCPITLCGESFYRTDKIRLHLQSSHKDDEKASCPISMCGLNDLPWILIRLHIRNHFGFPGHQYASARPEQRGCPVQSCQQGGITAESMCEHLQSHDFQDRIENKRHIVEAGYDPISTKISCPVCRTLCETHQDFKNHVEQTHIVKDRDHLHNLRDIGMRNHGIKVLWTFKEVYWTGSRHTACCADMTTDPKHHLKYLYDPEELRPYRITLLRLYPELGAHPIFDDIMPKVDPYHRRTQ